MTIPFAHGPDRRRFERIRRSEHLKTKLSKRGKGARNLHHNSVNVIVNNIGASKSVVNKITRHSMFFLEGTSAIVRPLRVCVYGESPSDSRRGFEVALSMPSFIFHYLFALLTNDY